MLLFLILSAMFSPIFDKPDEVLQLVTLSIRIGPDRAYPLHFTRPQLLLPVLLPLLCVCALHFRNEIGMESVSFSFLGPIL